jgi:hypothetical protein
MKKKGLIAAGSFFCLSFFFLVRGGTAGIVIEQVIKGREGMASRVELYYSESRLRTDRPESGLTTVMDFKEDRLILIDHRSGRYVDAKLSQWEKEVGDRLKKERHRVQPKKRKLTLRKTGEKKTINGFKTEKVEILADGELVEEDWVTRDMDLKEVDNVMEKAAGGVTSSLWLDTKEGREIFDLVKPYGFPILTRDYGLVYGLGGIDVLEVKKIKRQELKDEIFEPPAGYQPILPEPLRK